VKVLFMLSVTTFGVRVSGMVFTFTQLEQRLQLEKYVNYMGTNKTVFYSGCNGPSLFRNLQKYRFEKYYILASVNLCDPNPCQNNGTCDSFGGNVNCTCPAHYSGDLCEGTVYVICDNIWS
jgi:hypothetical protein